MTRRVFHRLALVLLPLSYGAGFVALAWRYLSPLPRRPRQKKIELAQKASYFADAAAQPVELEFNDRKVYVLHDGERIRAFDAQCTHLECNVVWKPELGYFKCPCHGACFWRNGAVKEKPAPLPLRELALAPIGDDGAVVVLDRYVGEGEAS